LNLHEITDCRLKSAVAIAQEDGYVAGIEIDYRGILMPAPLKSASAAAHGLWSAYHKRAAAMELSMASAKTLQVSFIGRLGYLNTKPLF
jgi:hypothetical protein